MSVNDLVDRFKMHAIKQDEALLENDQARVNALVWTLKDIHDELKSRPGDQRIALLPLFEHPNPQVQLKTAKATLALAPAAARQVLEVLAKTCHGPQRLDASMTIWALDEGIFKPM